MATRRPSTHHPLASGAASFDPLRHLPTRHKPSTTHGATSGAPPASHLPSFCATPGSPLHSIRYLAANHPPSRCASSSGPCAASVGSLHAICPPVHRTIPASPSQAIRHRTAQHPPTPARHPLAPCRHLLARTDALNDPQNKPSARAGAPNPRKNTFCAIVNYPLQIKPVFYFLFTSIASPAHRIRVKSSLLRLGRSCLALPFTHSGKDIT